METIRILIIMLFPFAEVSFSEPHNLKYNVEYVSVDENGTDTIKILFTKDSLFFSEKFFWNGKHITYGVWSLVDTSKLVINTRWKPREETNCDCLDFHHIATPSLVYKNLIVNLVDGGLEITFENNKKRFFVETSSVSIRMKNLVEYYEKL
ncbi:MAG: hypothetical protein JJU02_15865 [Cryomorphaceae bacterium]|nr:hypothetical protein [Cryomorphaceae bacterium]